MRNSYRTRTQRHRRAGFLSGCIQRIYTANGKMREPSFAAK